ncbi:MAG: AAA family ATPase [Bdellovibrionales bacterium]
MLKSQSILFFILTCLLSSTGSTADKNYNKSEISDARFGTEERQEFLEKAHKIKSEVGKSIFGQDRVAEVLQAKALQYIETFPSRTGEPVSLNLIGLPGVGKTGMVGVLKNLGFNVLHLDAQKYLGKEAAFTNTLESGTDRYMVSKNGKAELGKPVIIVIDEIDKVAEIDPEGRERTVPLIGVLNSILSEGFFRLENRDGIRQLSNALIITTMNYSPNDMEKLSEQALKQSKSYYEFSIDDFKTFNKWIQELPSARYQVLASMFRSNTVSRLAPNTVIVDSLGKEEYRKIIEKVINTVIYEYTLDKKKQITITYDNSMIEFLMEKAIFAPSGARETIVKARALVEQLIGYSSKSFSSENKMSIDRPRKLHLGFGDDKAQIQIIGRKWVQGKIVDGKTTLLAISFDELSSQFRIPADLATQKPRYEGAKAVTEKEYVPTKRSIKKARFTKKVSIDKAIFEKVNSEVLGQSHAVKILLEDMATYMGRKGPSKGEPNSRIFGGFPGIGKSKLIEVVAREFKLPVVKINMQQFSGNGSKDAPDFINYLTNKIANEGLTGQKYILSFEEIDKLFEIDPKTGALQNRPVLSVLKDLLNEGIAEGRNDYRYKLDTRGAFHSVTMNFAVDIFGFTADPRLTTIRDVIKAYESLAFNPLTLKSVLGGLFLPDTVSRLFPKFVIMRPLEAQDYRQLISAQVNQVVSNRLLDSRGINPSQIEIELSPKYKKYLFNETVIPSEGARYTVISVQSKILSDLEFALKSIPRSSSLGSIPIVLNLDFSNSKEVVLIKANAQGDDPRNSKLIAEKHVSLQFPSVRTTGKISPGRLLTSAHEFGHALVAVEQGLRIQHVVVVSPRPGTGGYVKFESNGDHSAKQLISSIYAALASRALERIVMSSNPRSSSSVLSITMGASQDISMATNKLYHSIYSLAFDPRGGTIDRSFGGNANIVNMPDDIASKIGTILRNLEDFMVEDLLKRHSAQWFRDKILRLARAGTMNERDFYNLIEYKHKQAIKQPHSYDRLVEFFGSAAKRDTAGKTATAENSQRRELMEEYFEKFKFELQNVLHADIDKPGSGNNCSGKY